MTTSSWCASSGVRATGTGRRCRNVARRGAQRRAGSVLDAEGEGLLEVVLRVRAERDVRLRADDAVHLADPVRDDVGELLVLPDADHGDEVDLAGDGVDLAHAGDLGDGGGD